MPKNSSERLSPDRARKIAEECYGEVLAYCRRHAPAGHDPADLAQETFLRFVRAGTYAEHGKPAAYLMRIARSVCIDASRKRQLETVSLEFEMADESSEGEQDSGDEPNALAGALTKLPSELREVVELRYGAELGVSEVAVALGISRFAVRRRINTALKLLKQELEIGSAHE